MTIYLDSVHPAKGEGRMTPEQLLSAPWRHYGERVLLGAGLLDAAAEQEMYDPAWRSVLVAGQRNLNMRLDHYCVLGITSLSHSYADTCERLGMEWEAKSYQENSKPFRFGFLTDGETYLAGDPAAEAYRTDPERDPGTDPERALAEAWVMYCEATASNAV